MLMQKRQVASSCMTHLTRSLTVIYLFICSLIYLLHFLELASLHSHCNSTTILVGEKKDVMR
jgi:hypothetical protein